MPSRNKLLCVFGDSHIGSVRKALDAGVLKLPGFQLEFFGAAGETFRKLHLVDDAIRPTTDAAAEVVAHINGKGRVTLAPGDFDMVLFYGCRLRLSEFFPPLIHHMQRDNGYLSDAVLRAAAARVTGDCRAARMAKWLAGDGRTRVFFAPSPLLTWGVLDMAAEGRTLAQYPRVDAATRDQRDRLFAALSDDLAEGGVALIRQPEHTIVEGVFTDAKYAIEGADESGDAAHKSPEFAALMVDAFVKAAK